MGILNYSNFSQILISSCLERLTLEDQGLRLDLFVRHLLELV